MPAVNLRRVVAAVLSTALLLGSTPATFAADDPGDSFVAPPSIGAALASLTEPSGVVVAAAPAQNAKVRLPACEVQDQLTRYSKPRQWKKTLLDTNLKIGRDYEPWDLVSVRRAGIAGSGKVRAKMITDLKALAAAARKAGKPLAVRSAWRSYDYQRGLFDAYVRRYGRTQALKFSARAGHSEHQMGTTIDFSVGPGVPLSTRFGDSPSGKWLARNGWKYGFIMSYPKGKRSASCYVYEPWHWRYFGRDLARKIKQSGQVPRRYLYENFETAP
jgi:zinc D-Ala-D-Ala carboxypeptidase